MSLNISLYNISDEPEKIRKNLPTVTPVTGTIKDPGSVDILNPVILLSGDADPNCNYCYIDFFDRYYFVKEVSVRSGLCELHCSVDVLMSYQSDILALPAIAARAQTDNDQYSSYLYDNQQRLYTYKTIATKLITTFTYGSNFVLITAG